MLSYFCCILHLRLDCGARPRGGGELGVHAVSDSALFVDRREWNFQSREHGRGEALLSDSASHFLRKRRHECWLPQEQMHLFRSHFIRRPQDVKLGGSKSEAVLHRSNHRVLSVLHAWGDLGKHHVSFAEVSVARRYLIKSTPLGRRDPPRSGIDRRHRYEIHLRVTRQT